MAVLRLVDRRSEGDARTVTVEWQAPGFGPRSVTVPVDVTVDDALAELVRWYLEEYAEFPSDPAPALALRAESMLAGLGSRLFDAVFGTGAAAGIWGQAVAAGLDGVRVEVDTDPSDVPGLPWELLRESGSDRPLVLAAAQFVRTHREVSGPVPLPQPGESGLRVLLVICRPGGSDDVPFRSVASRLVRSGADRSPWLQLDVLRPPTFAQLGRVLSAAADAGSPYHVVHFDGHGTYLDTALDDVAVSPLRYGTAGPQRSGRHGYLLFEDPSTDTNQQLVDGPTLARMLVRHRVPVLVLNACRSAYAEAQAGPEQDSGSVHDRIRAYGSLAAEVADAGVAGVVAMRYNVYVVTAAQFVADLYTHLGAGHSLGQAATTARQQLAHDPTRHIGDTPIALQDWVVPTIYETQPLTLLGSDAVPDVRIRIDTRAPADNLPAAPEVGFFGRDDTLLALDRAFDRSQVILLHALAGAGKSTTVAEFARWYAGTGGLHHSGRGSGPVLWTSFERHTPLDRVLDTAGVVFADTLEADGVHWSTVTDRATRRQLILTVLAEVPVLWIWDNVEPVAGFPDGTPSAWTDTEQTELRDFLHDLKTKTRAKVLLTSRRDEQRWLGLLPTRLQLPPLRRREQQQFARAVATHLAPSAGQADWTPVLRFTGGNPLTITVTVRQAVRENATSPEAMADFVTRVTSGRAALEHLEDAALGRSGSLAASLDYGFTTAFTDRERATLALLHLFRETVDVDVLELMGKPELAGADAVPVLAGFTRDAASSLLDRAVDVGLLSRYGGGYYAIHPALPWYFHSLHIRHVGPDGGPAARAAARAYIHALGYLGRYYNHEIEDGNTGVLAALRVEESNLLHAVDLAGVHDMAGLVLSALDALNKLYAFTGRDVEWARLVDKALPDYLTPLGRPRPGLEDCYGIVTQWRVRLAHGRRDLTSAAQLQADLTAWSRERAGSFLDTPAADLDPRAHNLVRDYAVCEQDLGLIRRDQGDPAAALPHFRTHHALMERIGDTVGEGRAATSLGNVYILLHDLDRAQYWHQRGLDLTPANDPIGQAAGFGALGMVAYARFRAAAEDGAPEAELLAHLTAARDGYRQALDLLPADHHDYRAVSNMQLGRVYSVTGKVGLALRHYQQAILHQEARDNVYGAAQTRVDIARLLGAAGRPGDALHYIRAARTLFLQLGADTAAEARSAAVVMQRMEQLISGSSG